MNTELELSLKLQAYVDGELSEREAREIASLIEQDAQARALVGELRLTRGFLAGNEPEVKLPETREFYWSKIQREIDRLDAVADTPAASGWNWRRLLAPLAGLALVAVLGISTARFYDYSPFNDPLRHLTEVENESEHMGSFSFRSHSENMFVVWVYDKTADLTEAADTELDWLDDEAVLQ